MAVWLLHWLCAAVMVGVAPGVIVGVAVRGAGVVVGAVGVVGVVAVGGHVRLLFAVHAS